MPHRKKILLSDSIEEAYRLGASFVLPKPFTARALVERIHDALHSDRP